MSESKLKVESYNHKKKIIRITPTKLFDFNKDASLVYQTVLNLARVERIILLFDLSQTSYPSSRFIAFLIEMSSLLRRQGGDLLIINLSETARMNFVTFNTLSFLHILDNEKSIDSKLDENRIEGTETENINRDDLRDILTPENESKPAEFTINDDPPSSLPEQDDMQDDELGFEELVSEQPVPNKSSVTERIVVHSRENQLYKLTDFIAIHAELAGFSHTEISRIKISVYEAAHNIIEHAYQFNSNKYIELNLKYDQNKFTINLVDKGKPFDYDPNRDYDAIEAAEERRTGGFGLHIIKRSMDDVKYESNPIFGNRLTMIKNIA